MFVTPDDFSVIPYVIPNAKNGLADNGSFSTYIDDKEEEMLKSLLGATLYNSFIAGVKSDWVSTAPTVIDQEYAYGLDVWKALTVQTGTAPVAGVNWELISEDDKWLRLKKGDTYLLFEREYDWVGMVKMLKPFIYSEWLRDTWDTHTGIGIVQGKSENASVINPSRRIVDRWNEFARIVGNSCNEKDTLYGFLSQECELGTFDGTFDDSFQTFNEYFVFNFKDPGKQNLLSI